MLPLSSPLTTPTAGPFLKWAGGKRGLLPSIRPLLPKSFGTYYEPFIGGGALFFDLAPRQAALRDVNDELVTAYRAIRDDVDDVVERLGIHARLHRLDLKTADPACKTHQAFPYYYEVRAQRPDELDDVETAARLIYVNRTCFNGLFRVNAKGQFNVPAGRYKTPDIVQATNLKACSARLAGVELGSGDFCDIEPKRGDFVYLDPPYATRDDTTATSFTGYSVGGFGPKDQARVRDFAVELGSRGVAVVVSNNDTDLVRRLYVEEVDDFDVHEILAPRAMNSRPGRRHKVAELLILGRGASQR